VAFCFGAPTLKGARLMSIPIRNGQSSSSASSMN
jgi:hypothetical protein